MGLKEFGARIVKLEGARKANSLADLSEEDLGRCILDCMGDLRLSTAATSTRP